MDRDDMYHACLLVHGPPPQQYRQWVSPTGRPATIDSIITAEFFNYKTDVHKWLYDNFEMRGDVHLWFNSYYDWTQRKSYHG